MRGIYAFRAELRGRKMFALFSDPHIAYIALVPTLVWQDAKAQRHPVGILSDMFRLRVTRKPRV